MQAVAGGDPAFHASTGRFPFRTKLAPNWLAKFDPVPLLSHRAKLPMGAINPIYCLFKF